ncbi:contact-dependent growth inhibition system immunity protein [Jatrophihabitans sp.]|jgi:hypothetical protein|uniref:contact-dependent growth inhibition system immunity protein n=1 Tax=Jatrophihabitans sp. TaxID=1932789 RepID=UPI002EFFE45A
MTEFEALETLLGGYLHEDWADDHPTALQAIDEFAHAEPDYAPLIRADVDEVVGRFRSEAELAVQLRKLGLVYRIQFDGWTSHRDWLLAVADRVDEVLRKSPAA